jgi:hypothetical protein
MLVEEELDRGAREGVEGEGQILIQLSMPWMRTLMRISWVTRGTTRGTTRVKCFVKVIGPIGPPGGILGHPIRR